MNNLKTKLLSLSTGLLIAACGMAQDFQITASAQFQLARINVDNSQFNTNTNPGAGVELGFNYKLSDTWSINSGVGVAYQQSQSAVSKVSNSQNAIDLEGEDFRFDYTLSNYTETQQFTTVTIPLTIQFETQGYTRFYTRVGAAYQLLTGVKQDSRAQQLTTSGYFDRFNATLTAPAFAGFGTYNNIEFEQQDFDFKNSINATLELGIKEPMGNDYLYIGGFVEYGLNDIIEDTPGVGALSFNSNNPTDFLSNGNYASVDRNGQAFVGKARLFFTGVRLRYQFGANKK